MIVEIEEGTRGTDVGFFEFLTEGGGGEAILKLFEVANPTHYKLKAVVYKRQCAT